MKRTPRQLRLDPDVETEVKKISEATSLPQIEIIRQLVKAGVGAIKANDYRLPLPLRLKVLESPPPESPSAGLPHGDRIKKSKL